MNFHRFHKRYYAHLQDRAEDVVRMAALDTNNEKWFQGEMVLAFCASGNGCRIFSSEYYNKKADNLDWAVWDECVSERGIVTIEADVYRAVKTSKYASSNVRKVDFLMENQGELILRPT